MKRWFALAPLLLAAALAVLFAVQVRKVRDARYIPAALVGQPVPDVRLPDLDGGRVQSARALARPGALVVFFASWCAPCIEEAPALMALHDQGIDLVGVAWRDDPVQTRAMLARTGNPFSAVLVDRDGAAGLDFGVSGAPETYAVGPGGRIVRKTAGPLTAQSAEALLEAADARR